MSVRSRTTTRRIRYRLTCLSPSLSPTIIQQCMALEKFDARLVSIATRAFGRLQCVDVLFSCPKIDLKLFRSEIVAPIQQAGCDLILQPEHVYKRPKRLLCIDMDSTLVQIEGIDELAKESGVGKQVAAMTHRAMNGEWSFQEALRERVRLLKGLSIRAMASVYKRSHLTAGGPQLIRALQAKGCKVALLSGGFDYFATRFQKKFGLDYAYANRLEIKNGQLTGEVLGEIVDGQRKLSLMRSMIRAERLSKEEVVAIGDGANDLPMLNEAGLGIAFHAKPRVQAQAPCSLIHCPLDAVLALLNLP